MNYLFFIFLNNSFVLLSLAKRAGVFWGGIRYSLHVFSGDNITHHRTSHETQHGNHRVDYEKYCEAIYWKHHTSHLLTKNFTQYPSKHYFNTKIPSLLRTSKIPYQNQVKDIFVIFYNSSHNIIIISSSSHKEYM